MAMVEFPLKWFRHWTAEFNDRTPAWEWRPVPKTMRAFLAPASRAGTGKTYARRVRANAPR